MSAVILFRRSRLNHNSFASIVGAMARDGRTDGWRVILQNHTRTLPRNTRIIVYSFSTPELAGLISEVDSLKNRAGGALVVAGGPHPSADPEGTLKAGFDFVFVGEGEETFPEFICAAAKGEPGPPPRNRWNLLWYPP